jgi:hypothetical protein
MATTTDQTNFSIDLSRLGSISVAAQRVSSARPSILCEFLNLRPTVDNTAAEAGNIFIVPPSDTPTVVAIRSSVSSAAIHHLKSAVAVGVERRRQVLQIAKRLRELPQHAGRQDFHAMAFPVFDLVRRVHQDLLRFDHFEGNTCMILRYLRNSLMDREWNRYKEQKVADAVANLFERISTLETVERKDAKEAFRLFYELNLRVSPSVVVESGDDTDYDE